MVGRESTILLSEPLRGLLTAWSYGDGSVFPDDVPQDATTAVLLDGDPPAFRLLRWSTEDLYVWSEYDVAELVPYPMRFYISNGANNLGIAWGETHGDGRVGAHFLSFSTFTGNQMFGPELISEPINHSASSYAVWAAAAYHPQGHAVVWGGWHPSSNYAIYGRILRCNAWHETPPW